MIRCAFAILTTPIALDVSGEPRARKCFFVCMHDYGSTIRHRDDEILAVALSILR
jgi:hypothetical protein